MSPGRSDKRNHAAKSRRHRSRSRSRDRSRHRKESRRDEERGHHRSSSRREAGDETRRRDRTAGQSSGSLQGGDKNPVKPQDVKKPEEKVKPNFAQSGKLAEDTNKFNGVVVKYNEPPDAKKPKRKWRLYPFKGDDSLDFVPVHNQSAYLLGRDRRVADIPIDHPSCSQQHAAIQFRAVRFEREDGSTGKRVRPYVIDLESSNGTYLNNKRIDGRKFYEILEKDVLKFGFSSRDYVVMHEDYTEEDELNE